MHIEFSGSGNINMSRWLEDGWIECKVNQEGTIISRCNKCVFSKYHRFVSIVELGINLLVKTHAVSSDFHRVNRSCSLLPVEDTSVEKLISFSS